MVQQEGTVLTNGQRFDNRETAGEHRPKQTLRTQDVGPQYAAAVYGHVHGLGAAGGRQGLTHEENMVPAGYPLRAPLGEGSKVEARGIEKEQMRAAGGVHAVHAAAQGHYGVPPATYMSDPVIQESLSPFFQPVGIDVTRLPLTNPPIFQSSLASYNGPPQRRRISISNGQIGQLGHMGQLDDEDVMESIYDLQPPPLPQRRNGAKPFSKPVVSHEQFLARQHPPSYQAAYVDVAPGKPAEGHGAAYAGSVSSAPLHPHPEQPLTRPAHVLDAMASGPDFPRAASSSSLPTLYDAPPGTAAWKRARLLERNRIAASKCRQRKKIAQLQLQKDVDILTKENKEIRRELEYYQKLVSKFKRFIELHMETCNGSNGGVQIIEEMLKIDHSIVGQENDSGDKRDTSEEAPI